MAPSFVSLFSGAGGFDVGFDAAGFRCVAQVEIDKTARAVLGKHWPDVPRYEDVRQFGAAQVPTCDVVVGGFPCQDVSTAGKRKGFEAGERSSLFFEMVRVIRELRPLYVVWENVPGLLTADEGRNFAAVLVELGDLGFDGGWRTVDAQFFGVPQQRRRVFGVFARGDSGAERCAEILALAEGVRRRTPPRRKAGAGVAATLTRGSSGGGVNPPGRRQEDDISLVVAGTITGAGAGTARTGPGNECSLLVGTFTEGQHSGYQEAPAASALRACGGNFAANLAVFGGGSCGGVPHAAATLTAKAGSRQDFDTDNFVLIQDAREVEKAQNGAGVKVDTVSYTVDTMGAQAVVCHESGQGWRNESEQSGPLRAEGENRPSRPTHIVVEGSPAVCIPIDMRQASRGETMTNNRPGGSTGGAPGTGIGEDGDPSPTIAGSHTPAVCVTGTVTHTLTHEGADASEDGTGRGTPIVAFAENSRDEVRESEIAPCLQQPGGRPGHGYPAVRRLTPRECERLMGWPDDFTRWREDGTEIADGPRYRLCGNGVVGTVSGWLARRMMAVMTGGEA